jgi:hypothetical protein
MGVLMKYWAVQAVTSDYIEIKYLEIFFRASEGTLSCWSLLQSLALIPVSRRLTSGMRPVKISAE